MSVLARARDLPLVTGLRDPAGLLELSEAGWDLLLRQAAAARLLPRLATRLGTSGLLGRVPERPRAHLSWALVQTARHQRAVRHELHRIGFALGDLGFEWILLKGAAYLATGSPAASGRYCNDIDILVPRERLAEVELRLRSHGWDMQTDSSYDEHYYRRWMHELPPFQHRHRRSQLDVHHSLLPPCGRWSVDTAAIRAASRPLADIESAAVPQPMDLLLHAAAHLFSDGELPHGLRDLSDLDLQLRTLTATRAQAEALAARAGAIGLGRALWLACRYCQALLATPLPAEFTETLARHAPSALVCRAFDATYLRALLPWHRSLDALDIRLGRTAAYLRGHWLRMPLVLLLPHLVRKGVSPQIRST
jgi:hypothetical protein